jgi:hypothetical protein
MIYPRRTTLYSCGFQNHIPQPNLPSSAVPAKSSSSLSSGCVAATATASGRRCSGVGCAWRYIGCRKRVSVASRGLGEVMADMKGAV